jgi:hypothetical protein
VPLFPREFTVNEIPIISLDRFVIEFSPPEAMELTHDQNQTLSAN